MEQVQTQQTDTGPNVFWLIVKIAFVFFMLFLLFKFFTEKKDKEIIENEGEKEDEKEEAGYVERKTKPTKRKK